MSRVESIPQHTACPCGEGLLRRTMYSPDYAFGKVSFSDITVECPKCARVWRSAGESTLMRHEFHNTGKWEYT